MIILVGHLKGGVGKSTLTVNIATELQRQGKDVLILEADPTVRTVSNWAKDREENGHPRIQCVQQTGNLHSVLKDLDKRYDVVLVDAAGKDSKEMRTAMTAAHVLLAPMQPNQTDLDVTESLVETIEQARDFNPELRVLGLLNRASTHIFATDVKDSRVYLDEYPELPMANTVVYDRGAFQKCMDDGRGVVEMKDRKAMAEIQLLTQEVMGW
ncbi:AAA family ATPase [Paenarthrobacter ureafaciens]|uniref:AAA family ATPase n=1 Tax=Paenarthrobacter ureafaciens TaxID=37931 RepID=UPI00226ED316|nr:AAA family ATPase [Paenarthrobacter ureafaciens]MCY0975595.1 AAA family ATPase [Paenarthrobacter ureafaciens]